MGEIGRRGFLGLLGLGAAASALGVKATTEEPTPEKPKKKQKAKLKTKYVEPTTLKPDCYIPNSDISCFCDRKARRGQIGEHIKRDKYGCEIVRPGQHGGVPLGMFGEDVVEIDCMHHVHPIFGSRHEVMVGGKVTLFQDDCVVVAGPVSGLAEVGGLAYYDKNGNITSEPVSVPIGRFLSSADRDGFAKLRLRGLG